MDELTVNLDFDLELGAGARLAPSPEREARISEGPYAWIAGPGPTVSVRVPQPPPADFLEHLDDLGVPRTRVVVMPEITADARPVVFGWSADTARTVTRYELTPARPSLEAVRRVNAKTWADRLNREVLGEDPGPGVCRSLAEVEAAVAADASHRTGWVAKRDHGNAGIGNRRIGESGPDAATRRWLEEALSGGGVVVVERWRPRVVDLCTTFQITASGQARHVRVHELVHTAAGAFIGAVFDPVGPLPAAWARRAAAAALPVAREVAAAGYFGPVALDAFVWWDGDRARLRCLSDLNARMHASWPARRLWRRWAPDRVLYWRYFARRRLELPDDHHRAHAALGHLGFDPGQRRGALIVSPLALGPRREPVRRVAVAFLDQDRTAVMDTAARFRDTFER